MMRTVQVAVADAAYAEAMRHALAHSGPWQVEFVEHPDPAVPCVLVLDEASFASLPAPLAHPERVVLISRQDPQFVAQAWDAGIISMVSVADSLPTVLLAIMAASLRVTNPPGTGGTREISPNAILGPERISPPNQISRSRRCRTP